MELAFCNLQLTCCSTQYPWLLAELHRGGVALQALGSSERLIIIIVPPPPRFRSRQSKSTRKDFSPDRQQLTSVRVEVLQAVVVAGALLVQIACDSYDDFDLGGNKGIPRTRRDESQCIQ